MSKTFIKVILYILGTYTVVGFFILPYIVKSQIIKILPQEINAKIEVGSVYINPFLFKLTIKDVALRDLQDKELVRFKEFCADFELYSLASKAIHFRDISLLEPKVSLSYNADKTFNILNILKQTQEVEEDDNSSLELPRIILDKVSIKNGVVDYEDFTLKTPYSFAFTTIGLKLKNLDTDESNGSNASLRFYTTLGDGGFVDFKSRVESLASLKVKGTLGFEASKLYTQWKYFQDILNLEVADGKISFQTEYAFALDDINATKIDNLSLSVEDLRIKPKAKHGDVFNIDKLFVKNATILPFQQSVDVENISLDGLRVLVKRNKKEEIDWVKYVEINEDENATSKMKSEQTQESNASKPWDVNLQDMALKNIAVKFEDSAVRPLVSTQVSRLNLYAQNLTLLGEKPFSYQMDMQVNEKGLCSSRGDVRHKDLDVQSFFECKGLDITHYNSYIEDEAKKALKAYKIDLKSALLNFNANAELKRENDAFGILVSDANLALNSVELNKKAKRQKLLGFSNFLINGINLDTKKRSVALEKITLNNFKLNVKKYKNGSLNLENLVVPKTTKKTPLKDKQTQENPYSVKLKHFVLNSAAVEFKDYGLEKTATNNLQSINANVYDVDAAENTWLRYEFGMRVNAKGNLKSKGKLRHTPLKQSGDFDIRNISLTALTPYLQESAFVSVEDGRLSLAGTTEYEKSKNDADLRVKGSLLLDSLFVDETLHQTQLLSLGELKVKSYTFELEPSRLLVDEVDVNSFYVDASIDENKTLNFSKLLKKKDENLLEKLQKVEDIVEEEDLAFPYRILKVNVALGSAKFADYSIPLKFSTHIHDLEGALYSISNSVGDTTYVDIAGEIDKYASTRLKGSIDSANPKAYTDLDFNFKNIDLNSLSGYSANFAGHEIASGKLYLDLGYDILNGSLLGSNSVKIKKIKLGREVDDENVTVLPLGFVIGLLEDTDGLIDIDMPVEGNLDEPDFKYGTLVFKTFANIITKAVTSPFKFLGAMMGMDGEKLEYVAYEPASSIITPPQREKLDKVSGLLLKKPKILLEIAGTYQLQKDKEAIQMSKLINLVVKKSGIKNIEDHQSVMTIDMLEDIYEETKNDDTLSKIQKRLKLTYKEDAEYKRAYQIELVDLCRDMQPVSKSELVALGDKRAQNIVEYLVVEKMIDPLRVTQTPSYAREDDEEKFVKLNMEIKVK